MTSSKPDDRTVGRATLMVLLALAMFVNYADRGSLSIVAPLLRDRFALGNGELGLLLSAFFWTYALAQPIAGALTHRFDVRLVLGGGFLLWAVATLLSGLAAGFAMLFALRLMLGLGESVIFPANARIISCLPEHLRGRANGFIAMGLSLGPTAGTLAGGLILAHWGWRAVFFVLGGASLLWLLPWSTVPKFAIDGAAAQRSPPGYFEILGQRGLWGAAIGHFCLNYQFYLLLTWLPLFLVKAEHFSLVAMAWIGAGVYAMQALASLASGHASDRLVHRGMPATQVRKGFVLAGTAGCGMALLLAAVAPPQWAAWCLVAMGLSAGVTNPMIFTIGQTLSGPAAGGRWMGVQNFIGNLAGVAAPALTGVLLDRTGSFQSAFLVAAALSLVGIVAWGIVIEDVAPVQWRTPAPA